MRTETIKKGAISLATSKLWDTIKDIKTVSVGFHFTTRSNPDVKRGKEFTLDVDKTKKVVTDFTNKFRKGERDMAAYQYKIIWLNEMGEEQVAYVETEEERNAKLQALADDGYSPVWRNVE